MPNCPTDLAANLRYRREILELGHSSKSARDEIYIACQRDPVFWMRAFCWSFNPKDYADNPVRPFIPYSYQEEACHRINQAIGKHDLIFPKSRATGGTYAVLYTMLHRWLFRPSQSFLLASAKEDRCDQGYMNDPSTLFYKLDHCLSLLPKWMVPATDRIHLRLLNCENSSVFNGESTNADIDRGGRRTAILADEAAAMANADMIGASLQHVSNTVIWLSTFKGAYGHFFNLYDLWSREHPEWVIKLHWTMHPLYSKGLERGSDGKWTSPWYRHECARTPSKRQIASEIDMDPQASGGQYFPAELRDRVMEKCVLEPYLKGDLDESSFGDPQWHQSSRGRLLLWCHPDDNGKPPTSKYVIGFDIATGKGGSESSQSCAAVYDTVTAEKVAEFKSSTITPTTFARYAVLLGKWFHDAKLIWGSLGPGADFGKTLVEDCQYGNVYFRMEEGQALKKRTKKYGYLERGEPRDVLFSSYYDALDSDRIINRSREAVEELAQFIFSPGGSVEHCKAIQRDIDPENAGKLHGDIVVADAMANILLREYRHFKPKPVNEQTQDIRTAIFQPHSPGARYQKLLSKRKQKAFY